MTIDSLAQMLVLTWRVERNSDHPPRWGVLRKVFLTNWTVLPPIIKDLLHIQGRVSGDVIREETHLIAAAMRAGILDSTNRILFDMLESIDRLKDFRLDFPDAVAWLRTAIAEINDTGTR